MFSIIDLDAESQEAKGAIEFASSEDKLPRRVHTPSFSGVEGKTLYEELGIAVIKEADDPLFYTIKLPAEWTIMPTEHSMWTEVWDDKNRCRVNVFFKASLHDRKAYALFRCRYEGRRFWPPSENELPYYYIEDNATKTIIYSTENIVYPEHEGQEMPKYDKQRYQEMICEEWMAQHYPKWKEFSEYWD
jgi:hypothetical protein